MLFLFGKKLDYLAVDEQTGAQGAFRFKIVGRRGEYRAYILRRPPVVARSRSLFNVHMLKDGIRYYVCVVQKIRSYEKMEAVAKLWARRYMRYLATGMDYNAE